jgi:hypothetical protein
MGLANCRRRFSAAVLGAERTEKAAVETIAITEVSRRKFMAKDFEE